MVKDYYRSLFGQLSPRQQQQFSCDILVGLFSGAAGAHITYVFLILIANQVFSCSENQRALIISSIFFGFLFSLSYEKKFAHFFPSRNYQAAIPSFIAAFCALGIAFASNQLSFMVAAIIYSFTKALIPPAETAIWRDVYDDHIRGQLVTVSLWMYGIVATLTSTIGGILLDVDSYYFRLIFAFVALACAAHGMVILRMPTVLMPQEIKTKPMRMIQTLKENPIFAQVLYAWFLAGMSMHLILAQKTEYLVHLVETLNLSTTEIALYATAIPELCKLIAMPFFALLFDRVNFISLRILVNSIFLFYIPLYFLFDHRAFIVLGTIVHGIGMGGGMLMWKLGVTKFASKDQTGSFMAIHTYLTGIRGIIAPLIGYQIIAITTFASASYVSMAFMSASIMWLIVLKRKGY